MDLNKPPTSTNESQYHPLFAGYTVIRTAQFNDDVAAWEPIYCIQNMYIIIASSSSQFLACLAVCWLAMMRCGAVHRCGVFTSKVRRRSISCASLATIAAVWIILVSKHTLCAKRTYSITQSKMHQHTKFPQSFQLRFDRDPPVFDYVISRSSLSREKGTL